MIRPYLCTNPIQRGNINRVWQPRVASIPSALGEHKHNPWENVLAQPWAQQLSQPSSLRALRIQTDKLPQKGPNYAFVTF
jgi:hypothetical protein